MDCLCYGSKGERSSKNWFLHRVSFKHDTTCNELIFVGEWQSGHETWYFPPRSRVADPNFVFYPGYWQSLAASTKLVGWSLEQCLATLHCDIVFSWNFNDPDNVCLSLRSLIINYHADTPLCSSWLGKTFKIKLWLLRSLSLLNLRRRNRGCMSPSLSILVYIHKCTFIQPEHRSNSKYDGSHDCFCCRQCTCYRGDWTVNFVFEVDYWNLSEKVSRLLTHGCETCCLICCT